MSNHKFTSSPAAGKSVIPSCLLLVILLCITPVLLGADSGCGVSSSDFVIISDVHFNPFSDATLFNRLVAEPAALYNLYGSVSPAALKSFIYKTVRFFVFQIKSRFPNQPVLFSLGNNDAYAGDYNLVAGGDFLSETASLFMNQWLEGRGQAKGNCFSKINIINTIRQQRSKTELKGPEALMIA